MIKGFLNLPWYFWAVVALILAVIFAFAWPQKESMGVTGSRYFIIRWRHTLTWVLLAINFLLRSLSPSLEGTANLVALAGGSVYILFIVMTFMVK